MSHEQSVTIFHNPACGTSRNVLEMARAAGYAPEVVDYPRAGWTRAQLADLFARAGMTLREALRVKGTAAAELGLTEPAATDDAILDAMVAHPILVERPFVVTAKGVRLCRPSERVLELLDRRPDGFTKEDGERVA